MSLIYYQFLNGANSGSRRPREEVKKKENDQNLTPEMMGTSISVQLPRYGRRRALFFTPKLKNWAKIRVFYGTLKPFQKCSQRVFGL